MQLCPNLSKGGILADVLYTERAGHCIDHLASLSKEYLGIHGIIAVGGDGTLSECLQGLVREDGQEVVRKIPLS